MKIFILEVKNTWDNPIDVFVGAFSTKKKAKEFIQQNRYGVVSYDTSRPEYTIEIDYTITEHEIDSAGPEDIATGEMYSRFSRFEIEED